MARGPVVWVLALGLAVALPWIAEAVGYPYAVTLASRVAIFALVALSLDLILGHGGLLSFGHAAFFGLGAYTVAILAQHSFLEVPIAFLPGGWTGSDLGLVAWPLAMLVAGLAAAVIGALSLRTSGLSFIMITLAFAQMLFYGFVSLKAYGGEDGLNLWSRSRLPGLDLDDDRTFYFLTLAILVAWAWLQHRLLQSRFGLILKACRDNEARLRRLGVETWWHKLAAFVIAGMVAGLAGALMANQSEFVSPSFLAWERSGEFMIMVILGGIASIAGPILGATALILMEEVLAAWTEHWMLVLGPLLILVVLTGRRGLLGLIRRDRP